MNRLDGQHLPPAQWFWSLTSRPMQDSGDGGEDGHAVERLEPLKSVCKQDQWFQSSRGWRTTKASYYKSNALSSRGLLLLYFGHSPNVLLAMGLPINSSSVPQESASAVMNNSELMSVR